MPTDFYASTFRSFDADYQHLLTNAAHRSRLASDQSQRFSLIALQAIASTFEILLFLDKNHSEGVVLMCPFSTEGLEFYRLRYHFGTEEWQRVLGFFAGLSEMLGEDIFVHLQRELRLPCEDCQALCPLEPLALN